MALIQVTAGQIRETYRLARSVGLSHERAIIATAIAIPESSLNDRARGDRRITTSKWGPSIGRWQIRSLWAENGTGRPRDGSRLTDPRFNARSMYVISNGGRNWEPWSVYLSGAYRAYLPQVRTAVGDGSAGAGGELPEESRTFPGAAPRTQLAGYQAAIDVTPWGLPLNPFKLPGWIWGKAEEAGEDAAGAAIAAAAPLLLSLALVGAGLTLVVIGLVRTVTPAFRQAAGSVAGDVADVATTVIPAAKAGRAAATVGG